MQGKTIVFICNKIMSKRQLIFLLINLTSDEIHLKKVFFITTFCECIYPN